MLALNTFYTLNKWSFGIDGTQGHVINHKWRLFDKLSGDFRQIEALIMSIKGLVVTHQCDRIDPMIQIKNRECEKKLS